MADTLIFGGGLRFDGLRPDEGAGHDVRRQLHVLGHRSVEERVLQNEKEYYLDREYDQDFEGKAGRAGAPAPDYPG
nr:MULTISPECIES: hypothetical protein [Pandoraea]